MRTFFLRSYIFDKVLNLILNKCITITNYMSVYFFCVLLGVWCVTEFFLDIPKELLVAPDTLTRLPEN